MMRKADSFEEIWCLERLRAGGEGEDRGWDGWMASLTQWTWVWVDYGSWWWTGRPGVLQSMGSQRFGHDWVMNWTELNSHLNCFCKSSYDCFSLWLMYTPISIPNKLTCSWITENLLYMYMIYTFMNRHVTLT